jgi:hypothetical protein
VIDFPKTGDVFQYPYLWAWQDQRGETEGRKDRPCCTALVIPLSNGQHRIYILAITTKQPTDAQNCMAIPRIEVQRAKLSSDKKQWVILDEWNREILETSFYISEIEAEGQFSKKFTDQLLGKLQDLLQNKQITTVERE